MAYLLLWLKGRREAVIRFDGWDYLYRPIKLRDRNKNSSQWKKKREEIWMLNGEESLDHASTTFNLEDIYFSQTKNKEKKIVKRESQIFLVPSTVHSTQGWNIGPACNSVILLTLITMPSVAMIVLRCRSRRFFGNNSFRCDTNHAVLGDCLPGNNAASEDTEMKNSTNASDRLTTIPCYDWFVCEWFFALC